MSSVHMGFHANEIPNFDICTYNYVWKHIFVDFYKIELALHGCWEVATRSCEIDGSWRRLPEVDISIYLWKKIRFRCLSQLNSTSRDDKRIISDLIFNIVTTSTSPHFRHSRVQYDYQNWQSKIDWGSRYQSSDGQQCMTNDDEQELVPASGGTALATYMQLK